MSLVRRGRTETTGNVGKVGKVEREGGYEKMKGTAVGERKGCGKEDERIT